MTAVHVRQQIVAVLVIAFGLGLSNLAASELNDSIQAFHRGDYKTAVQGLNGLIQKGEKDARVHYYRGLISFRSGDRQAAAADFQTAMQLEAVGHSQNVSESLQRVQGHERLVIEKYRAMARLAAKQRTQPVAPPPLVQNSANTIQLTMAEMPTQGPLFRLASEVPIRTLKSEKPFADDGESIVADEAPGRPTAIPDTSGEPVGTGVATDDDPFADIDSLGASDFVTESAPTSGGKPASVLGSVFRALFRANVPKLPPGLTNGQGILPPGMAPGAEPAFDAPQQPMFGEEPAEDGDDPFADF